MGSVILVTFAGREGRMGILKQYIDQALAKGLIDEWHIWDFTRSESDHRWVSDNFGPVRFMHADAHYQSIGDLSVQPLLRLDAKIEHDLHIAFKPQEGASHFYELVVGGWRNSACALRRLPIDQFKTIDRDPADIIWHGIFPGILSPGTHNQIILSKDQTGALTCSVNGIELGSFNLPELLNGAQVSIKGGWGASLEIQQPFAQVQRFIGSPGAPMPYSQAYDFYGRNIEAYQQDIFLKCDDDVVYMDLTTLGDFIRYRATNPDYFILSANVVNNGVCAHYQQLGGNLPAEKLGLYENPPGGFQGSLWQYGQRATELHDHFLNLPQKQLPLPDKVVTYDARISINFIAWLGRDLVHLALPPGDDERYISVDLPTILKRPIAIYSDFVVSHLSFGIQDKDMPIDRLIADYTKLVPSF